MSQQGTENAFTRRLLSVLGGVGIVWGLILLLGNTWVHMMIANRVQPGQFSAEMVSAAFGPGLLAMGKGAFAVVAAIGVISRGRWGLWAARIYLVAMVAAAGFGALSMAAVEGYYDPTPELYAWAGGVSFVRALLAYGLLLWLFTREEVVRQFGGPPDE